MKQRVLAVDGTNVIMRYAFAMLGAAKDSPSREDIERVAGSAERALISCAGEALAFRAVVAFDSPRSWRKDVFPAYKANRQNGEGTGSWSGRFAAHLSNRGWTCLSADGFEADDVLATVAARAIRAGWETAILTGDSDLLQLASDATTVWQFGKGSESRYVLRSPAWIAERYGIQSPGQLALYKALAGESGDNLPGCKRIGPVRAKAILRLYPSAEAIVESGVVARRQFEEMLRLVTLREDVPLGEILPSRIPGTFQSQEAA